MTSDLILGTPFLTQIYPFYVNGIGLHTKIMGKTISFNFLMLAKQKEILIYKHLPFISKLIQSILNKIYLIVYKKKIHICE